MTKKNIFRIIISLIGITMMGFEMGRQSKTGESNDVLHYAGLFIVVVGAVIVLLFNKKKSNN